MSKSWIYLIITCFTELIWLTGFNLATQWWQWALLVCLIVFDFYLLFKACEGIPVGTVYAIFSAVGTSGAAIIDSILFDVEFTSIKLLFFVILIIGIVSLKLADNKTDQKAV